MTILDSIRIHRTSLVLDYWMDVEGVPTRGRAQRRADLRANLTEASEQVGFPTARRRLGSLRELARAAAGDTTRRPRWVVGTYAALTVLIVVAWVTLLGATAWIDGALAAGVPGRRIEGHPFFLPWITAYVDNSGPDPRPSVATLGFTGNLWAIIAPTLVAFLLGSRIWRLVTQRRKRQAVTA